MYQVAICDDEVVFSAEQEKACHEIFDKLGVEYRITAFDSSSAFLAAFAGEQKRYDLILLDIIMDGTNGMELAKIIRDADREAVIIFVTSSRDYILQGYDVNALHYLVKPVEAVVLERLITTAYQDKFQCNFFMFKSGAQSLRIAVKDIIALETTGRKVTIRLPDTSCCYSGKLTELLDELPKGRFVRCHQAFAINIGNVRELTRQEAVTVTGEKIPVSRTFLKDVQTAFLRQMQEI